MLKYFTIQYSNEFDCIHFCYTDIYCRKRFQCMGIYLECWNILLGSEFLFGYYHWYCNRPFPSSLVRLFQSESKCETILMKMTLICMRMKLHAELNFIWKVSHLDSFWIRGTRELGNGLFKVLGWAYKLYMVFIIATVLNSALPDSISLCE